MKKTSFIEFRQWVGENIKFNQLAYHYLYQRYGAKTTYEKKQLRNLFNLIKTELRNKESVPTIQERMVSETQTTNIETSKTILLEPQR